MILKVPSRHFPAIPFEFIMMIGAGITFSQGNWKHLAASLFTLTVCLLPLLVEKWARITFPAAMHFIFAAFVFASFFSGEVLGMYAAVPYWDDLIHFSSGFIIGIFAMTGLVTILKRNTIHTAPAWFGALCVFCATLAVSLLWEIAEFTSDQLFKTFSQGNNLFDTMMDIVYETMSAMIIALMSARYLQGKRVAVVGAILGRFEKLNP